jgi:hypothetical protein
MPYRDRSRYRPPRRHIARVNHTVARLAVLGLTPGTPLPLRYRDDNPDGCDVPHW